MSFRFSSFIFICACVVTRVRTENMQCKGVDIQMTEDHMMSVKDCLKEAGAKELKELRAEKAACFGKCVMIKRGLIDAKGTPHKENIMKMVTDTMPKAVHDDLNKRMETCLSPDTTNMIDPSDESCETYMPICMCIHLAFLEVCE